MTTSAEAVMLRIADALNFGSILLYSAIEETGTTKWLMSADTPLRRLVV